mmetsp:Transcript_31127/g.81584  ORF Transcript_31127/g.81584 Transcript_31127/m.81584 type:complete len:293 (+) Transcript_31127:266-1144(+)
MSSGNFCRRGGRVASPEQNRDRPEQDGRAFVWPVEGSLRGERAGKRQVRGAPVLVQRSQPHEGQPTLRPRRNVLPSAQSVQEPPNWTGRVVPRAGAGRPRAGRLQGREGQMPNDRVDRSKRAAAAPHGGTVARSPQDDRGATRDCRWQTSKRWGRSQVPRLPQGVPHHPGHPAWHPLCQVGGRVQGQLQRVRAVGAGHLGNGQQRPRASMGPGGCCALPAGVPRHHAGRRLAAHPGSTGRAQSGGLLGRRICRLLAWNAPGGHVGGSARILCRPLVHQSHPAGQLFVVLPRR